MTKEEFRTWLDRPWLLDYTPTEATKDATAKVVWQTLLSDEPVSVASVARALRTDYSSLVDKRVEAMREMHLRAIAGDAAAQGLCKAVRLPIRWGYARWTP